jgi:aminoglycoside phosphotransferase (APT) family kinase protein
LRGLIDFDSICRAEPALDVGQFLTYLELTGLKAQKGAIAPPPLIAQVHERFLATYADAAKLDATTMQLLRERVRLYQAISLLRRVLRSWQKFKPSRIEGALAMLEEVVY